MLGLKENNTTQRDCMVDYILRTLYVFLSDHRLYLHIKHYLPVFGLII